MSLFTDEQFAAAYRRKEEADARLTRLFGFSPAVSDHYGMIRIYNQKICRETSDEELLAIRGKYLLWKEGILAIFAENGIRAEIGWLDPLFSVDGMYGTLYFLGRAVDIHKSPEVHRPDIVAYLENEKRQETAQ